MSLPELDMDHEGASCVLVVEDEVLVRMAVADELREAGLKVIEAKNADKALQVIESDTAVDLIFSDVQMPGSMDGAELARAGHEEPSRNPCDPHLWERSS